MGKSLFSDAHQAVVQVLTEARHSSGLHQAELAQRVGKDQSYISNIERGQRRVDIVEFYEIAIAIGIKPEVLFMRFVGRL